MKYSTIWATLYSMFPVS